VKIEPGPCHRCHRPRPRRYPGKSGLAPGFSLLEVLVAFVIVALVATTLFLLFGGALRNAAAADEWSRALLVAESRLALAAHAQPLREGVEQGSESDGRIRWRTSIAPYETPDTPEALARLGDQSPIRLYRVSVDVRFPGDGGGERVVSMSTLKLAARNLR
jgi:general secretion pathway protein I